MIRFQFTKRRTKLFSQILATFFMVALPLCEARANEPQTDDELAQILEGEEPKSLVALQAFEGHVENLIEQVTPATVAIRLGGIYGSAVIVSADGIVLTAGHVSGEPGRDATFIFPDGTTAAGETLGHNSAFDAGMARITDEPPTEEGWPFVEIGSSSDLEQGDWLLTMGHPGGYMQGRLPVSRLGRVLHNLADVICTDCLIVGGDSGGPLFNMQGEVVGIHSKIGNSMRENYHAPIDAYHTFWEEMSEGTVVHDYGGNNAHFGIVGSGIDNPVIITVVGENSPAGRAGIQVGDTITKFDDIEVPTLSQFMNLLASKEPGDEVVVELQRGEETLTLTLELANRQN